MNINKLIEIWGSFTDKMTEIGLYRHATDKAAKNEYETIKAKKDSFDKHSSFSNNVSTLYNMAFKNAISGKYEFYNHSELDCEALQLRVVLHKNKQYQWLLTEAYEAFEDYIEKLYAYCGFVDNSQWPLKDYGNITILELQEKDFEWFISQSRKKENKPHSMLEYFRRRYPDIKKLEVKNSLKVNLKLTIILAEQLRHYIVHNGGKVTSRDLFINNVAQKAGLINNGNIKREHSAYIEFYLGEGFYENQVILLEIKVPTDIPLPMYHNRLDALNERLISYARLLYEHVSKS